MEEGAEERHGFGELQKDSGCCLDVQGKQSWLISTCGGRHAVADGFLRPEKSLEEGPEPCWLGQRC